MSVVSYQKGVSRWRISFEIKPYVHPSEPKEAGGKRDNKKTQENEKRRRIKGNEATLAN